MSTRFVDLPKVDSSQFAHKSTHTHTQTHKQPSSTPDPSLANTTMHALLLPVALAALLVVAHAQSNACDVPRAPCPAFGSPLASDCFNYECSSEGQVKITLKVNANGQSCVSGYEFFCVEVPETDTPFCYCYSASSLSGINDLFTIGTCSSPLVFYVTDSSFSNTVTDADISACPYNFEYFPYDAKCKTCVYSVPLSCSCGTTVDDPLFTGFDGRTYDFTGSPGEWFNLITERDHQLSVAMVYADLGGPHAGYGTLMDAVGVAFRGHRLQVNVTRDGGLVAQLDGAELELAAGERVAWNECPHCGVSRVDANAVEVVTPLFRWRLSGVAPAMRDGELWKAHLDTAITLDLHTPPEALHGALGHSLYVPRGKYPADDYAFHGPGEQRDYRVSGPFGTDFAFNLFGGERSQVSRSMLAARVIPPENMRNGFAYGGSLSKAPIV